MAHEQRDRHPHHHHQMGQGPQAKAVSHSQSLRLNSERPCSMRTDSQYGYP